MRVGFGACGSHGTWSDGVLTHVQVKMQISRIVEWGKCEYDTSFALARSRCAKRKQRHKQWHRHKHRPKVPTVDAALHESNSVRSQCPARHGQCHRSLEGAFKHVYIENVYKYIYICICTDSCIYHTKTYMHTQTQIYLCTLHVYICT